MDYNMGEFDALAMSTDGILLGHTVTIHRNGDMRDPKQLHVPAHWSHLEFLNAASQRLQLVPPASRVFNADGVEIEDIACIDDGEALFLSQGVSFKDPRRRAARRLKQQQAQLAAQGGDAVSTGSEAGAAGEPDMLIGAPTVGGYVLGPVLGEGGFGLVRQGQHGVTGEVVALKFLRKSRMGSAGAVERVVTEIQCLSELQHPHVIRLVSVFNEPATVVLALEYASGGDLRGHLAAYDESRVPEAEAHTLFKQIVSGVSYAHKHHICHRDLKLENILLAGDHQTVKITDFGLSRFCKPGELHRSTAGSLAYLPPEVLRGTSNAGPPIDVWALGVILYALLFGRLPFAPRCSAAATDREREADIRQRIQRCDYKFPDGVPVSVEARDLIRQMLHVNPDARITVPAIYGHPWLVSSSAPHTLMFGHGSPVRRRSGKGPTARQPGRSAVAGAAAASAAQQTKRAALGTAADRGDGDTGTGNNSCVTASSEQALSDHERGTTTGGYEGGATDGSDTGVDSTEEHGHPDKPSTGSRRLVPSHAARPRVRIRSATRQRRSRASDGAAPPHARGAVERQASLLRGLGSMGGGSFRGLPLHTRVDRPRDRHQPGVGVATGDSSVLHARAAANNVPTQPHSPGSSGRGVRQAKATTAVAAGASSSGRLPPTWLEPSSTAPAVSARASTGSDASGPAITVAKPQLSAGHRLGGLQSAKTQSAKTRNRANAKPHTGPSVGSGFGRRKGASQGGASGSGSGSGQAHPQRESAVGVGLSLYGSKKGRKKAAGPRPRPQISPRMSAGAVSSGPTSARRRAGGALRQTSGRGLGAAGPARSTMGAAGARLAASVLNSPHASTARASDDTLQRQTQGGAAPRLGTGFGSFTLAAHTAEASLSLPVPPPSRTSPDLLARPATAGGSSSDSPLSAAARDTSKTGSTAGHLVRLSPIHMPMPAPAPVPRLRSSPNATSAAPRHAQASQRAAADATTTARSHAAHKSELVVASARPGSPSKASAVPATSARRLRRRSMLLEDEQADVCLLDSPAGAVAAPGARPPTSGSRVTVPFVPGRQRSSGALNHATSNNRRRRGSRHGGVLSADGDVALDAVPVPALSN